MTEVTIHDAAVRIGAEVITMHPVARSLPRLRALRKASGWSRKDLARRSSVDVGSVRQREQGNAPIPDDHLAGLADLLGVRVGYLLDEQPTRTMTAAERAKEAATLLDAADAMRRWADQLPAGSDWRWAFLSSRHHMLTAAEAVA